MTKNLTPPKKPAPVRKSGDSARADAEAAKTADRLEPVANPEALLDITQGAVDEYKEQVAAGQVEPGRLEQVVASLSKLAAAVQALQSEREKDKQLIYDLTDKLGKGSKVLNAPSVQILCPVCHQVTSICGKDGHTTMMVMPQDWSYANYFEGVRINGVPYLHRAVVPKALESQIRALISRWEMAEKARFINRGKILGDISTSSASPMRTTIM